MSARPSEVKALADLLDNGDFESSKDAAKSLILELERQRIERREFAVVCVLGTGAETQVLTYGPFPTWNKAREAIDKGKVATVGVARHTIISGLWNPQHTHNALEEHDGNGAHR